LDLNTRPYDTKTNIVTGVRTWKVQQCTLCPCMIISLE